MAFFILPLLSARDLDILQWQITCYCPIAPEANNTPQIMLLLHMQIRRYFNKICDNRVYLTVISCTIYRHRHTIILSIS